jgi:uncharacterized protein (DUF342 family)
MDFDTQDLPSYIAGYDEYIDTSKPVYSTDDWYERERQFESELEEKEEKIEDLLDKLSWIKDKLNEIKNKDYVPTKEDIKYIEEIVEEEF